MSTLKKIKLTQKQKEKLPVFCTFTLCNVMIGEKIEKKLFAYDEKRDSMYGRELSTRPLTKIINIDEINEL